MYLSQDKCAVRKYVLCRYLGFNCRLTEEIVVIKLPIYSLFSGLRWLNCVLLKLANTELNE